ncbi:PepSY domain-containing protein [Azospirillum sp. TSA6c]|uniref:PepSY domain-containing protein n=1 Tax=Azospirillum sp. TSA6c TaxID=709813 RepID=UPI000D6559F1|nr:PepSY domain-containing protein [Azospirillum sp. TSA6c]
MKTVMKPASALCAALLVAGIGYGAHAAQKNHEDARDLSALSQATISLSQAVTAAEQETGGKALSADILLENGKVAFGVELAKDKATETVVVDATSGTVVKRHVAKGDGEEQEDNEAE